MKTNNLKNLKINHLHILKNNKKKCLKITLSWLSQLLIHKVHLMNQTYQQDLQLKLKIKPIMKVKMNQEINSRKKKLNLTMNRNNFLLTLLKNLRKKKNLFNNNLFQLYQQMNRVWNRQMLILLFLNLQLL